MFYRIKPECPVQMGKDTEFDENFTPWKVSQFDPFLKDISYTTFLLFSKYSNLFPSKSVKLK